MTLFCFSKYSLFGFGHCLYFIYSDSHSNGRFRVLGKNNCHNKHKYFVFLQGASEYHEYISSLQNLSRPR